MSHSRINDSAMTMTASVVAIFAPLLREEEKQTAFDEVVAVIRQGLVAYEELADRMHRRLHPLPSGN